MSSNESYCKPINRSRIELWPNGFDGIPEIFLINLLICVGILALFLTMRAISWKDPNNKYNIYKSGWLSLIFRDVYSLLPTHELKRAKSIYKPLDVDKPFFKMVWYSFFKLTNEEILERCGTDAMEYLQFLHHVIQFSVFNSLLVLAFVLPINFELGTLEEHGSVFSKTTVSNIDFRKSYYLWPHILVTISLITICFVIIRRFSTGLLYYQNRQWSEKTVLMTEVGKRRITSERIEKYIKDIFPSAEIEDIKLVYKYRRLIDYNHRLREAQEALEICNHILTVEKRRVLADERCWCCHEFFKLPKGTHMVDGITFYEKRVEKLRNALAKELSSIAFRVLRFAYVTFKDRSMAYEILARKVKFPEVEEDKYWKVEKANDPGNILWRNLTRRGSDFSRKTLFINTAVFLIAVFLTTPAVIISSSGIAYFTEKIATHGTLIRYLPTLLTWFLSVSVAALVTYSSSYLDFETKSLMHRSIMRKSVIFLLFSVVILPSLGLTSLSGFFEWTMERDETYVVKWACIFLPDNGAFFISYVLTSAFVGNPIQLLRLSELFFCFLGIIGSHSEAEKIPVRKSCVWDFYYGVQYSYGLLIFTIVIFFSVWFPVIAPAGLLYFLTKLLVDRYNIYFSCLPSRNCYKVHELAIQFMMFALVLKIIGLFFLMYIRRARAVEAGVTQAIMWIVIIIYFVTMNPFAFKFIPRILLMPHKQRTLRVFDAPFEESTEKEVFHPFALVKYKDLISPVDKYGNPLPTLDPSRIDSEELLEIFRRDSA